MKTPNSKTELIRFIGSTNFYSKPFYTLLNDNISYEWTPELGKRFNEINASLSEDAELAIPNTTHPFYNTVDVFFIGLGAILFQPNTDNKMQVLSYNSRNLSTQEEQNSLHMIKKFVLYLSLSPLTK